MTLSRAGRLSNILKSDREATSCDSFSFRLVRNLQSLFENLKYFLVWQCCWLVLVLDKWRPLTNSRNVTQGWKCRTLNWTLVSLVLMLVFYTLSVCTHTWTALRWMMIPLVQWVVPSPDAVSSWRSLLSQQKQQDYWDWYLEAKEHLLLPDAYFLCNGGLVFTYSGRRITVTKPVKHSYYLVAACQVANSHWQRKMLGDSNFPFVVTWMMSWQTDSICRWVSGLEGATRWCTDWCRYPYRYWYLRRPASKQNCINPEEVES